MFLLSTVTDISPKKIGLLSFVFFDTPFVVAVIIFGILVVGLTFFLEIFIIKNKKNIELFESEENLKFDNNIEKIDANLDEKAFV
nr:hypothetical protein [Bacilli bacterium]